MSTTARESSVDSSKTENASIRKYLTTSTQITQKSATATATATATTTTATTTKLPLNSPSDNIVKPPFAKPATLKHSKSAIDGKRKSSTQSSNSLQAFFYQQKRQRTTAVTKGKTTTLESAASHLDTANEKWLRKPLALPSKSEQGVKNVDRGLLQVKDMASAQAVITRQDESTDSSKGQRPQTHNELIAEICGYSGNKRILSPTTRAPEKQKEDKKINLPDYKMTTTTAPSAKRRILSSVEKVLDAPSMADDYYLNLLDWSKENIVAVGLANSVFLWSADDGSVQRLNYKIDDMVTSLAWSADSCYLSVGTHTGQTQVWDIESNTLLRTMNGQNCRIGVLAWDRHIVTSGAQDGSIYLHDVRVANHKVSELNGHTGDVCGLKWRWEGGLLASGGNDSTVNIWDPRNPSSANFTKKAHKGAIKALAWCPWNHNLLATGGGRDDKNIFFWNASTGSRVNSITTGSQVTSLHWSKHYKEIVSTHGYPHNQLTIWAYPSLNKIIDIPAHDQRILHSSLSPDGQTLATAAADECLKFWKIFDNKGKQVLNPIGTVKAQGVLKRSNSLR